MKKLLALLTIITSLTNSLNSIASSNRVFASENHEIRSYFLSGLDRLQRNPECQPLGYNLDDSAINSLMLEVRPEKTISKETKITIQDNTQHTVLTVSNWEIGAQPEYYETDDVKGQKEKFSLVLEALLQLGGVHSADVDIKTTIECLTQTQRLPRIRAPWAPSLEKAVFEELACNRSGHCVTIGSTAVVAVGPRKNGFGFKCADFFDGQFTVGSRRSLVSNQVWIYDEVSGEFLEDGSWTTLDRRSFIAQMPKLLAYLWGVNHPENVVEKISTAKKIGKNLVIDMTNRATKQRDIRTYRFVKVYGF
ncbi:MAG: hypothetical protein HON90_12810 [Halobacteriovoraceae bacterium]|jgi:hypothetical protein|nr:hypothetical protein [Halobacteriovoraceae bacterium]